MEFKVIGKDWGRTVVEFVDGTRQFLEEAEFKALTEPQPEAEPEVSPETSVDAPAQPEADKTSKGK